MSLDVKYMKRALRLAKRGAGAVSPNPMVGCVIVRDGMVVGEGYHQKYGKAHAEINALKQAGIRAKGATLYVTLEPCFHYGKTPPCVNAVIKAGINKVVMAMRDPNPKVNGKSVVKLKKEGLEVVEGVCEQEAKELNKSFIKAVTKKRPYVIAKVGQSVDNMITTQKGQQGWLTGKEAKKYVQSLRCDVDAVLIGVGTLVIDNPKLNVRNKNKPQPKRVVLDPFLEANLSHQIFTVHGGHVVLCTALRANHKKVKQFRKNGVTVITGIKAKNNALDLNHVLQKLFQLNIQSVLVEGGAKVFKSFLKAKLVDEWQIITAPKIVGKKGLAWISKTESKKLKVTQTKKLGKDILMKCY